MVSKLHKLRHHHQNISFIMAFRKGLMTTGYDFICLPSVN